MKGVVNVLFSNQKKRPNMLIGLQKNYWVGITKWWLPQSNNYFWENNCNMLANI